MFGVFRNAEEITDFDWCLDGRDLICAEVTAQYIFFFNCHSHLRMPVESHVLDYICTMDIYYTLSIENILSISLEILQKIFNQKISESIFEKKNYF